MTEIWTQPYYPFTDALARLRVPAAVISPDYFPIAIDTHMFTRRAPVDVDALPGLREMKARFDFVAFHPSRLMMKVHPALKAAGLWKNNDALFQGFARFVRQEGVRRAGLVLIERSISPDVLLAKQMIASLGLEEHVAWLKPPRHEGFTRHEMISLYSMSDVVADEFSTGWFGSVVLESCALECAVIGYIDEAPIKRLYPWHPVVAARTPEDIEAALLRLYRNPEDCRRQGALGRRWVSEFHAGDHLSRVYAEGIRRLAAGPSGRKTPR
jgi:glycosyltransferase involved in cell wall biosynthesis